MTEVQTSSDDPPLRYDPAPEQLRSVNPGQIASFARTCTQSICAYLVGRGLLQEDTAALAMTIAPPIVVWLAVTAYGLWKQSDFNVLARAAKVPITKKIVLDDPLVATDIPNPKVVGL